MATVFSGDFAWDDAKALANEEKHGVTFEDAALACEDPLAVEGSDLLDAGRIITVGMSPAGVLVVVTTEVGDRTRIHQRLARHAGRAPQLRRQDPMTTAKAQKMADDLDIPEITEEQWKHMKRGQRAGRVRRVPLVLLRKTHRKTQVDVSEAMSATQGEISRLEAREDLDDVRVATLRRYVEAIGGKLELVARFGDRRYAISGGPTTK